MKWNEEFNEQSIRTIGGNGVKQVKKLILSVMIMCMMAPIGARAEEGRSWWPDQIDESNEIHDIKVIGWWPNNSLCKETAINTILFRPKVTSAKAYSKSTKVTADVTTAARVIIIKYSADGKHWEIMSCRNAGYKGPVICIRKWQGKLHAKEDSYSSWCARQFKQGKVTLDYKKVAHTKGQGAQLYFDDRLIDGIRRKVSCVRTLNIPARAKVIKIRYAYTGMTKECFSEWLTIRVR